MKRRLTLLITTALSILMLGTTLAFVYPSKYFEIVRNLDIFAGLYKEVNTFYVDDINPTILINEGIESMLTSLDPYTVYISEDKIEDYRTLNTGQYAGIGATTVRIDSRVYIAMIYNGFVAQKAGLQIGDEVVAIDGKEIAGLSSEELNQLVKGQAKSKVVLIIHRAGNASFKEYILEREKVTIPNVPYFGLIAKDVGYIKFTEFTPGGSKNIRNAINKLKQDGATSLILDLRGNPGGALHEAVAISNLFIPKGKEVVRTIGKVTENNHIYKSESAPLDEHIPLAILINSRSASASEIVAGSLQDYDRAVMIGQKSYGKGLVQRYRDLPYKSQMKITVAKYYIPSGRCIQAVDYSNRNEDGSVGKIPDSLKVAFNTTSGRIVFDGGGIDPDVPMDPQEYPSIAEALVKQGYLFRYGTLFKLTHETISKADAFDLTDQEFSDFVIWMTDQESFVFKNQLEHYVNRVIKDAEDEKKKALVSEPLNSIIQKTNLSLTETLQKNKSSIINLLETEIASRYYYQKGVVQAGLGNDPEVKRAIDILHDPVKYLQLLSNN